MKELLRIVGGVQDQLIEDALYQYNLEVYEGEILYIQGIRGSGIHTLTSILAGDCALKAGSLFLNEKKVQDYNRNSALQYGIYTITAERDLVGTMMVAENLEAVRYLPFAGRCYSRQKATEKVADYLIKEQAAIQADDYMWTLSRKERKQLSILKAKMHGAHLIVLDATREIYEGREAEEICGLIRRSNEEGITFILLSEYYSMLAEIATRVQVLSQGIDLMEWRLLDDRSRKRLRNPLMDNEHKNEKRLQMGSGEAAPGGFLGLYDYEWEIEQGLREYLFRVRQENPELWEREICIDIPQAGCISNGKTVLIPQNSGEMLLDNLSIADNLILPIPRRVSRNRFGTIPRNVEKNILEKFYRTTGISRTKKEIQDLNRVQKKILSIYRLAISHPSCMILESPYSGFHSEEVQKIRRFLMQLDKKGIRILYFSRALDEMERDCGRILITKNGKSAKMTTLSHFFPPGNIAED